LQRLADLLAAGDFTEAGVAFVVRHQHDVAGKKGRMRARQVQEHVVPAGDRDHTHRLDDGGAHVQSAVILRASIRFFHLAYSAAWKAAKCSGVSATISKPCASSLSFTSLSFSDAA